MRIQTPVACSIGLSLLLLITAGCGSGRSDLVEVTGKVTLDGQPVNKGKITFEATDGKGGVEGGSIENGEYSVKTTLGSKAVKINSPKVVGERKTYGTADSPTEEVSTEAIPKQYNRNTELKIEVSSSSLEHDFDLKSK
ncbi:hypothetical protein Pan97_36420 [Bremerella volcania]|uniref:Carboxypeptidase regulatory-like domain-containing protein n=1 Tax=Bremerella volcania TaxID=2527984 RepID=A0A518CBJ9_9BACT|nr:hypothetical protein [Bremerella volcania]QDU76590.1 hypothetical protein Pan97_36420 [Bremerella volcania]